MKEEKNKKVWTKPKMETLTHEELVKTIVAGACSSNYSCPARAKLEL